MKILSQIETIISITQITEGKVMTMQFDRSVFDTIQIKLKSSYKILKESFGEVTLAETIHYRTWKPEPNGLFCMKIFGPVRDYTCFCEKYTKIKYKGIVCDKCGVEITTSRVRRERIGHINLAVPVVNILFLKSTSSHIANLLGIQLKEIEQVLYYEKYCIIDSGITKTKKNQIITIDMFEEMVAEYGEEAFVAKTGGSAILELLKNINLVEERDILQQEFNTIKSETNKKKIMKRLKIINDFIVSGNKPEWMVITTLPVLPPSLRPLVMLDAGRFASSDLNELYRTVIRRNNRLKSMIAWNVPEFMIKTEKRLLQEAVDILFANGKREKPLMTSQRRPYKSLSDMLQGKQGRFRQNLLGKRVDYSGRSVIVPGPDLELHQCGIPRLMALELFRPMLYNRLIKEGFVDSIKSAKMMVDQKSTDVWKVLHELANGYPVLLNRAPTLHRLGVQAFEIVLTHHKAIRIHPLVCVAFNADFDGDTMSVYLLVSLESIIEARNLIMSTNNIINPANGYSVIAPQKDIILGLFYLTKELDNQVGEGKNFSSFQEIHFALETQMVTLHAKINFYFQHKKYSTTVGRVVLLEILPEAVPFDMINVEIKKSNIPTILHQILLQSGNAEMVRFSDQSMKLGFKYATISGCSLGINDLLTSDKKDVLVGEAEDEINELNRQYMEGMITREEKYSKSIQVWSNCTDNISSEMMTEFKNYRTDINSVVSNVNGYNSLYLMYLSGARGSADQMRQISGIRGLMTKSDGKVLSVPIKSNFKTGLTSNEYFDSTYGTRKGLSDTALKTATSGYLTRRLVVAAQDIIISEFDCGTEEGIKFVLNKEVSVDVSFSREQLDGRILCENLYKNGVVLFAKGTIINEHSLEVINVNGITEVVVRSVIKCKAKKGVCSKCYGIDQTIGRFVAQGEAVGIIAAQSIGEPTTQLVLRTFHSGGAAQGISNTSSIEAIEDGYVKYDNLVYAVNSNNESVIMSRDTIVSLYDVKNELVLKSRLQYGSRIYFYDKDKVTRGEKIADWNQHNHLVIADNDGVANFVDIIDGKTLYTSYDEETGMNIRSIYEFGSLKSAVEIISSSVEGGKSTVYLQPKTILLIENNAQVRRGDTLAMMTKEFIKTKDITGGLPRVENMFEAKKPAQAAVLAYDDGVISFSKIYKNKKLILLKTEHDKTYEYVIPKHKSVVVQNGEKVKKGDYICYGQLNLEELLDARGVDSLVRYMIQEISMIYNEEGVYIYSKHFEVIIRKMLNYIKVIDSGDSYFFKNDIVSKTEMNRVNNALLEQGKRVVEFKNYIQGITKASLYTDSFISAASFQETTRILTEAAIAGKTDYLEGIQESVIVGKMVPCGTGARVRALIDESKKSLPII